MQAEAAAVGRLVDALHGDHVQVGCAQWMPSGPPAELADRRAPNGRRYRIEACEGHRTSQQPHRLAVIGHARIPWFRLPDVQVVAARRTTGR